MNSHFDKFQFIEEQNEIEGGEPQSQCKGGLCVEKAINTDHPTVSQFKNLIVPIGLVLENRSADLHNQFINIDSDLQEVSESMFEQLFILANGKLEKSKDKK